MYKIITSLAVKGLKPAIKHIMMPQHPHSFEAARKSANLEEKTLFVTTIPVAAFAPGITLERSEYEALTERKSKLKAYKNSTEQEKALYQHREQKQHQPLQQEQMHPFKHGRKQWRKPPQFQQTWRKPPPPRQHWQQRQYQDWRQPSLQTQYRNGSNRRVQEDSCQGCKGEDLNCNYPVNCPSKFATCTLCGKKGPL